MNFWPVFEETLNLSQANSFAWPPVPTFQSYQLFEQSTPSPYAYFYPEFTRPLAHFDFDFTFCPDYQQQNVTYDSKKKNDKNEEIAKATRNLKSIILRDFIKSLKKDASPVLLLKNIHQIKFPVKNFIEYLSKIVPHEGKYIKMKTIRLLCQDKANPTFSLIFRILLKQHLKNECQLTILSKKRNKLEHLRICRELEAKIFESCCETA